MLVLHLVAGLGTWLIIIRRWDQVTCQWLIAIDPDELDPEVASKNNVMHLQHMQEGVSREGGAVLERKGMEMVGKRWRDKFKLLVCDANMDIRDTLRELVLPLAEFLAPGGVVIVIIQLGGRVDEEGIARKVNVISEASRESRYWLWLLWYRDREAFGSVPEVIDFDLKIKNGLKKWGFSMFLKRTRFFLCLII
jgi:SAM-dependent methyltransferase